MSTLPSWYPGDEAKPAPMPLLLVQAFLNTRDLEEGSDVLGDPAAGKRWLTDAGLVAPRVRIGRRDLDSARVVRESIRGLLGSDAERRSPSSSLGPLRELADEHAARLAIRDDGMVALENPRHSGLGDGLFDLLLIIRRAQVDGSWLRLKACANPDCGWVFYDRSRNQQGNWCNMAICGNRLKNRQLRARRR
jgi:predicted RNA-binding Zn ribbon-like protein